MISFKRFLYVGLVFLGIYLKVNIQFFFIFQTIYELSLFALLFINIKPKILFRIYYLKDYYDFMKKALPLGITSILVVIYSRITMYFLSALSNTTYLGFYAAAYRISDASIIIFSSIIASLFPIFSKESNDLKKINRIFLFSTSKIFSFSVITTFIIGLFASIIINLLYGGKYNGGTTTLAILSLWLPFATMNQLFTYLIISRGKQRIIPIIAVFNMLINLLANFFLVSRFFDKGSALATVITELINSIIQMLCIKYVLNFSIGKIINFVPALSFVSFTIVLIYFNCSIPLLVSFVILSLLIILYYFSGELKLKEILSFIKN